MQVGFIPVVHVVWTLYDLSNETTKAMQLNDVSAWSLVTSLTRIILGYMPQFVTVGHVVNKLPYIGLLSPTQLKEIGSCTLLAENAAKTEVQPRRLCLPLHPKLDCRHHSHSELSNLCAGSSHPPLRQVTFACIPAQPTQSCRVY